MLDVFCNIRDDEKEHVKTMKACRDYSIVGDLVNKAKGAQKGKQSSSAAMMPDNAAVKRMDSSQMQ